MRNRHTLSIKSLAVMASLTLSGQVLAQDLEIALNPMSSITEAVELNTAESEFGVCYTGSGILFTSSDGAGREIDDQTGRAVYRLKQYTAESGVIDFSIDQSSFLHEGPAEYASDQPLLFVTRNSEIKNPERALRKNKKIKLSLYSAKTEFDALTALPFNDKSYSNCHPTYWEERNLLLFASDRPGGYGGMDLYMVEKQGDAWGVPTNLGPRINSASNEVFPFIHSSGYLSFSSDRNPSTGLDVYVSYLQDGNRWCDPQVLDGDFQSTEDDFSLVFADDMQSGYLSSSRVGGAGSDDIYHVTSGDGEPILSLLIREQDDLADAKMDLDEKMDKAIENEISDVNEEKMSEPEKDMLKDTENVVESKDKDEMGNTATTETSRPREEDIPVTDLPAKKAFQREISVIDQATGQALEGVRIYAIELDQETGFINKDIYETRFIPTESGELLMKITKKLGGGANENLYSLSDAQGRFSLASDRAKRYVTVYYKLGYEPIESVMSLGDFTGPVTIPMTPEKCVSSEALVKDARSGSSITNARIVIDDVCRSVPKEYLTDNLGYAAVCITDNCDKDVFVEAAGYERYYFRVREGESWPVNNVFRLNPLPRSAGSTTASSPRTSSSTGTSSISAGTVIVLEDIYYELNKARILPNAAKELNVLADLMIQYDRLRVELRSHTDSRGGADYNQTLSRQRAESAKSYLMRRGVEAERISTRGFGESQLRNQCADGVSCSDSQHRYNRRTEVVILETDPRLVIKTSAGEF